MRHSHYCEPDKVDLLVLLGLSFTTSDPVGHHHYYEPGRVWLLGLLGLLGLLVTTADPTDVIVIIVNLKIQVIRVIMDFRFIRLLGYSSSSLLWLVMLLVIVIMMCLLQ